ncbi:hypothetical protein BAE44_0004715, partial [Dichanthelium oligosanthes]
LKTSVSLFTYMNKEVVQTLAVTWPKGIENVTTRLDSLRSSLNV